jgi:hypothetical protein
MCYVIGTLYSGIDIDIIIYCYSLIYFIFRGDTYVVSYVFACLMINGELVAGVRILLEKGPSRHHISKDQQF